MVSRAAAISGMPSGGLLCEVAGIELIVLALRFDEFIVGAPLDDASLLHDHDAVGIADGGEAMGDGR